MIWLAFPEHTFRLSYFLVFTIALHSVGGDGGGIDVSVNPVVTLTLVQNCSKQVAQQDA